MNNEWIESVARDIAQNEALPLLIKYQVKALIARIRELEEICAGNQRTMDELCAHIDELEDAEYLSDFDICCEVEGCKAFASAGVPSDRGYWRVCYAHYKKIKAGETFNRKGHVLYRDSSNNFEKRPKRGRND